MSWREYVITLSGIDTPRIVFCVSRFFFLNETFETNIEEAILFQKLKRNDKNIILSTILSKEMY
jgi:hypothetical protein